MALETNTVNTTNTVKITGTIKHIVYQNKDNGYTVLKTKEDTTLCGILNDIAVNLKDADFTANGKWKKHKSYGHQFQFNEFVINESDLFYFLSRIVKGIGKKMARHLLEVYKEEEIVSILDNRPDELLKIKGIKNKKLERIIESWNKFRDLKNLSKLLIPHGASQILVIKVYKYFLKDSGIVGKLKENPYLMTAIKGIGFKTADALARNMGIEPHSLYRVKACIDYVLVSYTADEGNSCISRKILFDKLRCETTYIDENGISRYIEKENFESALLELKNENKIVFLDDEKLTSNFLYRAETVILETISKRDRMRAQKITGNIEGFISEKEKQMGINFSQEQKSAICRINQGAFFLVLCGYAGTGKSTISRAVLDLLSKRYNKENIICCALSGIAADRIRKKTGYLSVTIQSLLVQASKKNSNIKNDNKSLQYNNNKHLHSNKLLPYNVLLVDEASMVRSELFYRLFTIIRDDCIIILVGDPAQLPPIGAGNPFHDIIEGKIAPVVELKRIYRQREDQVIAYFANIIREGKIPPEFMAKYIDFKFIDISIKNYFALRNTLSPKEKKELRDNNSMEIFNRIKQIASGFKNDLSKLFKKRDMKNYITYFQLITPIKNGILGVDNLNRELQIIFNPQSDKRNILDLGVIKFGFFDRVIHITNWDMDCYNPDEFKKYSSNSSVNKQRVFNGMTGVLFKVSRSDELLWVYYPNDNIVVEYTFDEARDLLKLSYALTIHKTQGSEYQNVLIPMTFSHFIMLNNKLLYTAITRARDMCIIVGENYAFASACKRKDVTIRDTIIRLKT